MAEAQQGAEALCPQAANHGETDALVRLALIREEAGDPKGAENLARQVADNGNTKALLVEGFQWLWPLRRATSE
ncbi:hypothetical protein [Streptomyces sp. NPDC001165]|uniref:hypothetical protein n=1 Tax=Streptomyces sp. NPDC001165 TaxID=3364546 RepID=UPI003681DDB6